ncbi:MAG: hypothetical protein NTY01_25270 [Verrucomicrobia bacterium]|nr:hypothetical protein [Verrucomicrobiota bacterium]
MRKYLRSLQWLALGAMAFLVSGASEAFAQARPTSGPKADFQIKRIEIRRLNPARGGSESGRGGTEAGRVPWVAFECEFDRQPEWADDVEVRWYVLLGGKQQVMGTGSDTYIYVKKGRRHVVAMLMHPMVMERWLGSTTQANMDVGVDILKDNVVQSSEDTKHTRQRWWTRFTATPGLLMRMSESPWATTLYADYEWSKFTTSKQQ